MTDIMRGLIVCMAITIGPIAGSLATFERNGAPFNLDIFCAQNSKFSSEGVLKS